MYVASGEYSGRVRLSWWEAWYSGPIFSSLFIHFLKFVEF